MVGRLKGMGRKGVAVGRLRIAVRLRNARWDWVGNQKEKAHKIAFVLKLTNLQLRLDTIIMLTIQVIIQ